jgi:hypothetical protein
MYNVKVVLHFGIKDTVHKTLHEYHKNMREDTHHDGQAGIEVNTPTSVTQMNVMTAATSDPACVTTPTQSRPWRPPLLITVVAMETFT